MLFIPGKKTCKGNSLAVQWLGLRALTAEDPGSIPGQGTKLPQAARRGQKIKKRKENLQNQCSILLGDASYVIIV